MKHYTFSRERVGVVLEQTRFKYPRCAMGEFSSRDMRKKIREILSLKAQAILRSEESAEDAIMQCVKLMDQQINRGKKIITFGSGASGLIAYEFAGEAGEIHIPVTVLTNNLSQAPPLAFRGIAESKVLSDYYKELINEGDVCLGISISGETEFVYELLKEAKKKNAYTALITEYQDSTAGQYADLIIKTAVNPPNEPLVTKIIAAPLVIVHAMVLVLAEIRGIPQDQIERVCRMKYWKKVRKEVGIPKLKKAKDEKIVVTVCGGFDPIHVGHIRHLRNAKKLGDNLVVLLQSDNWLLKKKGYVFMPFKERKEILESMKYVDEVLPVIDTNSSVAKTLKILKPNIFAKGGDRTIDNIPKSEIRVCKELGIKMTFGVGGEKIQSSSSLVNEMRWRMNIS